MNEPIVYNSERIYWAVEQVEQEAGDIDGLHLDDNLFYIKSEADKVIAEKDEELRHQKYKRCLAMAKLCEFYADSLRVKRNQCRYDEAEIAETYYIRCRRYRRWCKVWMELAEKFKEAK